MGYVGITLTCFIESTTANTSTTYTTVSNNDSPPPPHLDGPDV